MLPLKRKQTFDVFKGELTDRTSLRANSGDFRSAEGGQSGDKTRPEAEAPALYEDKQVPVLCWDEVGGDICYALTKICREGNLSK